MGSWQMNAVVSRDVLDHDLAMSALPGAPVVPDSTREPLRTRVAARLHAVARRLESGRGHVPEPAAC